MTITLIDLLKDASSSATLTATQWQRIIAAAREQSVLGRLYYLLEKQSLLDSVPTRALNHLKAAYQVAHQQRINVQREIREIGQAFERRSTTPVLLKGAAYSYLDLPCCYGRSFSDIDLLVPPSDLKSSQIALMVKGWVHKKEDEYNKEYYEKWMHEIQPMIHLQRLTVVDLHHNVLPKTNRFHFKFEALEMREANSGVTTLTPVDLFIHCAIHLFTEGELFHPLRDLTDLSMILDSLELETPIEHIQKRAKQLGVEEYVGFALLFCLPFSKFKGMSNQIEEILNRSIINRLFTLPCYHCIFSSDSVSNSSLKFKVSTFILYLRGHLHRMPLKLLLPHLVKKAFMKKDVQKTFGRDWL